MLTEVFFFFFVCTLSVIKCGSVHVHEWKGNLFVLNVQGVTIDMTSLSCVKRFLH